MSFAPSRNYFIKKKHNLTGLCKETAVCLLWNMNWFVKYHLNKTWRIGQKRQFLSPIIKKPGLLTVLYDLWFVISPFRECSQCVTKSKTTNSFTTNRPPSSDTFPTCSLNLCHFYHNLSITNKDKFPHSAAFYCYRRLCADNVLFRLCTLVVKMQNSFRPMVTVTRWKAWQWKVHLVF